MNLYNDVAMVKLHKKMFQELTTDELYELLRVRSEVFVVEQNCVYQDMDGDDQQSIHLWLTEADRVVALARVCPAGPSVWCSSNVVQACLCLPLQAEWHYHVISRNL